MSKSSKRKRPYTKPHNANNNVYGIPANKLERLLHGETEAEKLFREQQAKQEAATALLREARALASQKLYAQKKEEEAMSSLRESLEKAIADKGERAAKLQETLDDWSDDEPVNEKPPTKETTTMHYTDKPPYVATLTTTISEGTFNFVRNNPSQTAKDIVSRLHSVYGYNPTSTTSLISQMVRQGLIGRQDGLLYALVDSYKPIKSKDAYIKQQERQTPHKQVRITVKGEDINGIAALAKPPVAHSISNLLDNISVNEARALYVELKKLFGGN